VAMRAPRALDWVQPPYVRGGSYGVGEVKCHCLSAASSRAPCLKRCQRSVFQTEIILGSGLVHARPDRGQNETIATGRINIVAAHRINLPDDNNYCWRPAHYIGTNPSPQVHREMWCISDRRRRSLLTLKNIAIRF
jgi:hypothetical protein